MSKRAHMKRRKLGDLDTVMGGLRQQGCALCGRVVDPAKAVSDPRWEYPVHENCREKLDTWGHVDRMHAGRDGRDDLGWDDQQFESQVPR